MFLYDIIYSFYFNYIFISNNQNGVFLSWDFPMVWDDTIAPINGRYWLCDTFTIITLVLIVVVLIRLIIWLFKLFGNLLGGVK